jgi:hypothetical protein
LCYWPGRYGVRAGHVVGEGLISALGYDGEGSVPAGPVLLAEVPALLILIAPGSLPFTTATGHTAPAVGPLSCQHWIGGAAAVLSVAVNRLASSSGR